MKRVHKLTYLGVSVFFIFLGVIQLPQSIIADYNIVKDSTSFQLDIVPYSPLKCTTSLSVTTVYTDGTSDVLGSSSQSFTPSIYASLINPQNSKTVQYFYPNPKLSCTYKLIDDPTITGQVEIIVQYTSGSSTVANVVYDKILSVNQPIRSGSTTSIVSSFNVYPSDFKIQASSSTPVNVLIYAKPHLNFVVPNGNYNPVVSTWGGLLQSSFKFVYPNPPSVKSTAITSTPLTGCSGSICSSIPVKAGIKYDLTYDDGTVQSGNSASVVNVPILFDLFKQNEATKTTSKLDDITFTVIATPSDAYKDLVSVSGVNMKVKARVQMGDNQPFDIPQSDFSVVNVNSFDYGLAKINLPVSTLNQEIITHVTNLPKNAQQTSVSIQIDGSFNVGYNGKSGVGTITGLTWTFPILYGTDGVINQPPVCAVPNTQTGINPYGGSPSSGQSFNCTPYCDVHPEDPVCQTGDSTQNSQIDGGSSDIIKNLQEQYQSLQQQISQQNKNSPQTPPLFKDTTSNPVVNNGLSGFCVDTSDVNQCIMELLFGNQNTFDNSGLWIALILLLIGIIIIIVVATKRK